MGNQSKYIDKAYEEAMDYVDKTIKVSERIKNNYIERDVFYSDMKANEILMMFIYLAVGIAALVFKDKVWGFLYANVLSGVILRSLTNYLSMLYNVGFIVLILLGLLQLFKLIYAKKTNAYLSKLEKIASELKKEKGFANGIKNTVLKAIENFEYVSVGNTNNWEEKIVSYQKKTDTVERKTRNRKIVCTVSLSIVSIVAFYFVFSPYMISAIVGAYNYHGAVAVSVSYLLLLWIIYVFQMKLANCSKNISKSIGFVLFGLFQVPMIFRLKASKVFTPFWNIADYTQGNNPDWIANIARFSIKYLLNEGFLVMSVVSIIGLMNFIRTNPESEMLAMKNGVDIPLDDSTSRHIEPMRYWYSILLASLFVAFAPFIMSAVLIQKDFLEGSFAYLLIGGVWIGISTTFMGDKIMVYGERLAWIKNAFFFIYLYLTLALVPGFGFGSVALLLLQSVISFVALVFIVSI